MTVHTDQPTPTSRRSTLVDGLRRSSPHVTPTRTLRISEAEYNARENNNPLRLTMEELSNRPRSNPRTRTPRRYESPLNPGDFRREGLEREEPIQLASPTNEARRITIRPLAGSAVGTMVSSQRLRERRTSGYAGPSRKQGPSHRKIRRWNNDHFTGLASEIASLSSRGRDVADLLLKAQSESHLYRPVYDPKDSKSESLSLFLSDPKLRSIRDRFFEGELPSHVTTDSRRQHHHVEKSEHELTLEDRLNRVDARLRRLVMKAATNSYPAAQVIERFESFVVGVFGHGESWPEGTSEWSDLLLEPPSITTRQDSSIITVRFYFAPDSSTGGFHRLLLHAVCQFHGLDAESRTINDIHIGDTTQARQLTARGSIDVSYPDRLLSACETNDHVDLNV